VINGKDAHEQQASREVHLELLVGRTVRDSNDKPVGPLEEVRAEERGDEWVVKEYLVGASALIERLSAGSVGRGILKLIGKNLFPGYRVPWNKMDLSDPQRPRLTCAVDELEKFDPSL
jgi:hypothetical protein